MLPVNKVLEIIKNKGIKSILLNLNFTIKTVGIYRELLPNIIKQKI